MKRVLLLAIVITFYGCVPSTTPSIPAVLTDAEVDYQYARALVRGGNYHEALVVYQRILTTAPHSPQAADAEFDMAYLYVRNDFQQKDYHQALAGFEVFLQKYPQHVNVHEAKNWQVVLRSLFDSNKENERLKKNIEQLKKLDIRHEERRRK